MSSKKIIIISIFLLAIIFILKYPIYNPYKSNHKYNVLSLDYGLNIVQPSVGGGMLDIVVLSDFYYSDSCHFVVGNRKSPVDMKSGKCIEGYCEQKDGYFILNKVNGNLIEGLTRSEYLHQVDKIRPFMLSDPDSTSFPPLKRISLSVACPIYEFAISGSGNSPKNQ